MIKAHQGDSPAPFRRLSGACCSLVLLAFTTQGQAQQPQGNPIEGQVTETEEEAIEAVQHPFSPIIGEDADIIEEEDESEDGEQVTDKQFDGCHWQYKGKPFQEGTQDALRGMSCYTFRWFDGWFGDDVDYPENAVNGLLTVGGSYDQYDGFDGKLRLKVRAPLPNMDNRFDILLGRGDDEAFISDTQTQDNTFYNPGLINRGQEDSWLIGLGHRNRGGRKGWDWSVGLRLRAPPVPYVKAQWYYYKPYSDHSDLRFRQTFFWRSDDGFGSTSRGDMAWGVNATNVLRWEGVVTISDATEDFQWYLGQTWYHLFSNRSAFSLLSFVSGETGNEVPITEYGFNFIWRRPFTREWMYLSLGPSVTWPRFYLSEQREMSLGFGVWIEMEFGNWAWSR